MTIDTCIRARKGARPPFVEAWRDVRRCDRVYRCRWLGALTLSTVLASCGGSSDVEDQPPQAHASRVVAKTSGRLIFSADLRTALDGFSYVRASPSTVQDYDGVHLPLVVNEPGFAGGRRVKNEFLYSDEPLRWFLLSDGASTYDNTGTAEFEGKQIGILRVYHADGQTGAPYVQQRFSAEPGSRPPSLFTSRFMLRQTEGAVGLSWTHQGRTHGQYIGSESNSPRTSLSPTSESWLTTSQTIPLYEQHPGWVVEAPKTVLGSPATFEIAHMQFEDVTGFKAGKEWSSEYVPSSDQPGVRWFETTKATQRTCCSPTNPIYGTFNAANQPVSAGGDLIDRVGAPIDVTGLMLEGSATNLSLWSGLSEIGVAVLDGRSHNYTFTAPATAGASDIYLDPRSGRFTYRSKDIELVAGSGADRLLSTTTDFIAQGWRSGMGVWLFLTESVTGAADGGVQGPFVIADVSPHQITFTSSGRLVARRPGQFVNMARVPKPGDNILVVRNDGSSHRTKVADVILPNLPQSTDPDGYQHMSVRIDLNDAMPADGINGGNSSSNNNLPVYYYSTEDLPIIASPSNGGAVGEFSVAREWPKVVEAGYGFQLYNGLVYELKGGSSGNTLFDLRGAAGIAGRSTSASAIVRRVAGTGKPLLLLQSHPGAVPFTNAEFERVEWHGISKNGTGTLRVFVPPHTTVEVALPQVEQAAANREAVASSPIVTREAPVTRASAIVSRPWNRTMKSARIAFEFTPLSTTSDRQTLWAIYTASGSYAKIDKLGDKLQFVLDSDGEESVVEAATTPGTMLVEASLAQGTMSIAVNGVNGSKRATKFGLQTGTQYLGSLAGQDPAFGAIRNLKIYDTAAPAVR